MNLKQSKRKIVFIASFLLCLSPFINPPIALLLGFIVAITIGHPFIQFNNKATQWLLKSSVIGLGFGMNLYHAMKAGQEGFLFTFFTISTTLFLGWILGKRFKIESKIAFLISSGTAICGGSAIAAISPIIKANEKQISIALGTIFILNSIALLIFPSIGILMDMTQTQFGLWAAIAIHDTSSVVGAAAIYGQDALQIATTIKLERALWIIPLSFFTLFINKGEQKKIKIPYFIGFFIVAMVISTALPQFEIVYSYLVMISKKGLTLTLFLIGAGLSLKNIREVGAKPMLQGFILWILIASISMVFIKLYW